MNKIIITGGLGFIGSHLTKKLLENNKVLVIDKMTYAANKSNLSKFNNYPNFFFEKKDVSNFKKINNIIKDFKPDKIFHLAAESHVDRSINNADEFIKTNILGTYSLLEAVLEYRKSFGKKELIFHHVSTDEVFGDVKDRGKINDLSESDSFTENSKYFPSSPYSASKASSDHLVSAWGRTYDLPYVVSNCSNNYGPFQAKEKFIPNVISSAVEGKKISIYGDGNQIRDWIYVTDHIDAIIKLSESGAKGFFNIGGDCQIRNIDLAKKILKKLDIIFQKKKKNSSYLDLICYVDDRPGHDVKYSIDNTKIINSTNWRPSISLDKGLELTIDWYLKKN